MTRMEQIRRTELTLLSNIMRNVDTKYLQSLNALASLNLIDVVHFAAYSVETNYLIISSIRNEIDFSNSHYV